LQQAREHLQSLGLEKGCKFVSLHIRNGSGPGIRRSQPEHLFVDALQAITQRNYWIIRIGDPGMSKIVEIPKVIDLAIDSNLAWLHPYVLHEAVMHLGTNSGPSILAQTFGTPTLITNTTSVSRCTLTGSLHTVYLPKRVAIEGRILTLSQLLMHCEGYSELDGRNLKTKSITYLPNSSEEIRDATIERLDTIESNLILNQETDLDRCVDNIRRTHGAVSFGKFSPIFLSNNNWYLE
jgi:putative glycosyltransferase (TIGR04372 family)